MRPLLNTKQDLIQYYIQAKRNNSLDAEILTSNPKIKAWAASFGIFNVADSAVPERVQSQESASQDSAAELVDAMPLQSVPPLVDSTNLCLILHCEKYAYRNEKYVKLFRPILESLGFRCVYVMGYTQNAVYTDTTLVDDILHVPVLEGYTRCNLKMYHAYMWAKQQQPSLLLKIDDDITITNEAVFREEYGRANYFEYTVAKRITSTDHTSYIYKKDDPNYRKGYPVKPSTYGVGGLHFLSFKALQDITLEDMTQTIFEDLNMGLLTERYRWRVHDLNWIHRHVTTFEAQR